MPSPTHAFVRRTLVRAIRGLRRDIWATLPDEEALLAMPFELEPVGTDLAAGSRPQMKLLDRQGRHYLFKLAPEDHIAAELFAYRMRRRLGCLHVPAARRTITLPDLGAREGLLQPMIAHEAGRLATDPCDWSAVSIEHLLREHPWEWLLANLDTHVDQYLLVGPQRLPINIDWDHALQDLATTKLDRFNMRSATVAPIRNLFYSEYAAGRVRADFYGMLLEARRIEARISDRRVRRIVRQYCDERALPSDRARELTEQIVQRKRGLPAAFDQFVADLELERRESLGMVPSQRSPAEKISARVQDAWQRLAITVLHDHVVRPSLKAYRVVLGVGERIFGRTPRE